MPAKQTSSACPCGGPAYATCCGPYINGGAIPASAETLMRSRYTAYTRRDEAYLRATWHASTRPRDRIVSDEEKLQWLGLEVKSALRLRQRKEAPAAVHPDGEPEQAVERDTVEFVARYRVDGRAHRLREVSRFVREAAPDGARWFYLDGSFPHQR